MANKLEPDFVIADSRNLPKVDLFMIFEFISSDDRFNAPEVRGSETKNSCRESYGDNAVGYVCLKRNGTICTLKGQICPEHKVQQKNYSVILTVDEGANTIQNIECKDCAAAEGGCKNAFAFLMWSHRKSEEPASTDITCYWKKPTLSGVGSSLKYIFASELCNTQSTTADNLPNNSSFLEEVINKLNETQVEVQLSRYLISLTNKEYYSLSLHQILMKFFVEVQNHSVENFFNFAQDQLVESLCVYAEEKTRKQSEALEWHELRYGRITASIIYEASKCQTAEGSLVKKIIGAAKDFDNSYMARGRHLEKEVINELKLRGYEIESCGFLLIPQHPILGASPNGINKDYIVEVKCPATKNTVENYIENGKIKLKYKAQMMLQMLASKKNKGLFCVAHPNFENNRTLNTLWIDYEENFTKNIIQEATIFWKENIYPVLLKAICN